MWVHLECAVCGYEEAARPKKWWPEFTYVRRGHHAPDEIPPRVPGLSAANSTAWAAAFVGIADVAVPEADLDITRTMPAPCR